MFLDVADATQLPLEVQSIDSTSAAPPNKVHDLRLSKMVHAIPLPMNPHTKIYVFEIHKKSLVESTKLAQQLGTHHQASAVRPIDVLGLCTIEFVRRRGSRLHGRGHSLEQS